MTLKWGEEVRKGFAQQGKKPLQKKKRKNEGLRKKANAQSEGRIHRPVKGRGLEQPRPQLNEPCQSLGGGKGHRWCLRQT